MKNISNLCWFSCGITSAVAGKIALESNQNTEFYYIEIASAHPDNERFISDCEKWYGKKINRIRSNNICAYIRGLPNSQIPTIAKIKSDALSSSGLTERQVTRNVKISTSLIKTGLLTETTTGHICQIVGQFFKGNNLVLKKLKLLV